MNSLLIFLAIIGSIGILYFMGFREFIIVLVVAFLLLIGSYRLFTSEKIENFVKRKLFKNREQHFKGFSTTMRKFFHEFKAYLILVIFLKFFKWGMSYISIYFIFLSMGYNLNIFSISLIFSAVALISTVPITFSGIGVKEGVGAFMYNTFLGVPPAIASNAMLLSTAKNFSLGIVYYFLSSSLVIKDKYKKNVLRKKK